MASPVYYTADMVRELNQDDGVVRPRYETVHGELFVTPSPNWWHQELAARLLVPLRLFLRERPTLALVAGIAPMDVELGIDSLVQPDVFVTTREATREHEGRHLSRLVLAIEVLSPSTTRADRFAKRRLYQERGVPHYWVVDPKAELVEVWTPAAVFPVTETMALHWRPEGADVELVIPLAELFAPL